MPQILQVIMQHSKSTKGTHRFDSITVADKKLITCVYVDRGTFKDETPPAKILVTIDEVK